MQLPGMKNYGTTSQVRHGTSTSRANDMNKTTSRINPNGSKIIPAKPKLKTNNLMSDKD